MAQEPLGRESRALDETVSVLLVRLRPRIELILWHYRIPPQDSEDLVQEILVSFVRRHRDVEDPEAWLTTALKYQCLQYWRRRRQNLYQLVDESLLEILGPSEPSTAEQVRCSRDLEGAINKIPERCRRMLRLRYGLELTSKELAHEMGYERSSVSNILRRCLAALSRKLVAGGYRREACDS